MTYKSISNCLKASLLPSLLLIFQSGYAQAYTALEKIVGDNAKALGTDLALVVVNKDTILYTKGWGEATAKTVVPLGGTSAWLTAALVLKAVDEGKVSLDDKVAGYLPVVEKYGKTYITLRHCLAHLTGIQTESGKLSKLLERKKFASLEEAVNAIVSKEIQSNAGEAFRYSEAGSAIAGRVLEVVYKKKFDVLIRQKLLLPLGMRKTSFSTPDASAPNPASGAQTTAEDMARFERLLLNNGKQSGQEILSEAAVKELRTLQVSAGQVKATPKGTEGHTYTLGSWATATDGKMGTVLVAPGFAGSWAEVDFGRGYGWVLLSKNNVEDDRTALYGAIKKAADAAVPVKK